MATFWVEEDSNSPSNALTPSLAYADRRVTIKSRMRKSTMQRFRSTPKTSQVSNLLRRKSSPPPMIKRPDVAMGSLPGPQRPSMTRSVAAISDKKLGRTWSTISEPPEIVYTHCEDDTLKSVSEYLPV